MVCKVLQIPLLLKPKPKQQYTPDTSGSMLSLVQTSQISSQLPSVGLEVGVKEGDAVGNPVGLTVGVVEGVLVGLVLGVVVGLAEGVLVGLVLGVAVGVAEGDIVGIILGCSDGHGKSGNSHWYSPVPQN